VLLQLEFCERDWNLKANATNGSGLLPHLGPYVFVFDVVREFMAVPREASNDDYAWSPRGSAIRHASVNEQI